MGSDDTQGSVHWKIKLVFRLVMLVGLIIIWWGFGELVADYIIWSGIEWVRVSSVGTIVIGFGIVISTAIVDRMVDRLYGLYESLAKKIRRGQVVPRMGELPRRGIALLLIFLIIVVTSGSMFTAPVFLSEYSPPAAIVLRGESAYVRGHVYHWNATNGTSGEWIPAVGVDVRIFATDELISEIVTTNELGIFWANQSYRSGQVLTLTIEGQRFRAFIPYFPRGTVELGEFFLNP